MRNTDKAVGCNSHTKIKTLITENNSRIINQLFESLTSDTSGNFAHIFSHLFRAGKKMNSQPE